MRRIFVLISIVIMALGTACSVMAPPTTGAVEPAPAVTSTALPAGDEMPAGQEVPAGQEGPTEPQVLPGQVEQDSPVVQNPVKTRVPGPLDPEQFDLALAQAIEAHDYAAMRQMMGSSFVLAGWRSEGQVLSPDDALSQMSRGTLGPGSGPDAAFDVDTAALLDGADPLAFFPPDAVRALFVDTVGHQGADEALVIIGRDPVTGVRYWKGLLVAYMGFQQDTGAGDLDQFSEQLAQALQSNNAAAMRALMPARFSIATFNESLYEYTSDEALRQLTLTYFVGGAQPVVRWGTDVPALLGGADPLGQWGPVAQPVKAAHITGLGQSSGSEAVVVIGRDANGSFYWHGLLLPENGKSFQVPSGGEPGDVVETPVKTVTALEEINVRSGPGLNYAVEGRVRQGEVAQVSGISRDGLWWQIFCTQDASGRCWVSADPSLTRP